MQGSVLQEIGNRLGMIVETAESYRARIMTKPDIRETACLTCYAVCRGLVEP